MQISTEMRLWLLGPMLMLWIGIYFTGFELIHWLIYLPAVMSIFASITGLCPGMLFIRTMLKIKK